MRDHFNVLADLPSLVGQRKYRDRYKRPGILGLCQDIALLATSHLIS